jgi:SAM-dependent methyltransferase
LNVIANMTTRKEAPMTLDMDRIRTILGAPHSFYGASQAPVIKDMRLNPGTQDFIGTQLTPTMRVLDIGCGSGETLLVYSHRFHAGIGIDIDPAHIRLAQEAQHARGVTNVEFLLLDALAINEHFEPFSFDFVFSQRGPIGLDPAGLQAALRVLRPNGLLFCELIGEVHHQEARELFEQRPLRNQITQTHERARALMEQNGIDVRLTADIISKRYYPDIYAWLEFQCAIWTWLGMPLPAADDPRIAWFAERNKTETGAIETTHHVVWVAGVKHPHQ